MRPLIAFVLEVRLDSPPNTGSFASSHAYVDHTGTTSPGVEFVQHVDATDGWSNLIPPSFVEVLNGVLDEAERGTGNRHRILRVSLHFDGADATKRR